MTDEAIYCIARLKQNFWTASVAAASSQRQVFVGHREEGRMVIKRFFLRLLCCLL